MNDHQTWFPQYTPRPPEPEPEPDPRYPLTEAAEHHRRYSRDKLRPYVAAALCIAVVIIVVGVAASMVMDGAVSAAGDKAPVPSAQPGPPVPQRTKPVEKSPPVAAIVEGDGTWLIGKEIKRGTYRTKGGASCYWARLANLSGEFDAILANGYRNGPQVVALGPDDLAFASQGCGQWVMVK